MAETPDDRRLTNQWGMYTAWRASGPVGFITAPTTRVRPTTPTGGR